MRFLPTLTQGLTNALRTSHASTHLPSRALSLLLWRRNLSCLLCNALPIPFSPPEKTSLLLVSWIKCALSLSRHPPDLFPPTTEASMILFSSSYDSQLVLLRFTPDPFVDLIPRGALAGISLDLELAPQIQVNLSTVRKPKSPLTS
ncbi:hypothetical protein DFH09DRAFT_1320720 [Mycena vulgaris]|nr:hypothetical protein DFH09DRAFT_1320720 [Mycena vulgaris]